MLVKYLNGKYLYQTENEMIQMQFPPQPKSRLKRAIFKLFKFSFYSSRRRRIHLQIYLAFLNVKAIPTSEAEDGSFNAY